MRACFASLLLWIRAAVPGLAQQADNPNYVVSVETSSGQHKWTVELASDDESRQTGLMFRQKMASDAGMLFRFDSTGPVAMWMKNTFLPLDMVFLKADGEIAHIHRGAVPQSLEIISSGVPVRYVLELNAGQADLAGLQPGGHMRHPWFAAAK